MIKYLFLLFALLPITLYAQYWQQEVNNVIHVSLDDENNILNGEIFIDYHNNSPDTLQEIFFHVYPNAYKHSETAFAKQYLQNGNTDFIFSKEEDKGYIENLHFSLWQEEEIIDRLPSKQNSSPIKYEKTKDEDIIKINLPYPLLPGKSIQIHTPFSVKIPKVFSRLGFDGQAYQVSQWFPKPAVYDQNGWRAMPYLDQGEFYSEFGNYIVHITLPENYIVMATGAVDQKENNWLDSLSKLPLPAENLYKNNFPESAKQQKTITFKAENVHDFAWFADKRWIVRKKEINLKTGEIIDAYSCYLPKHQKAWENSINDIETAIVGYSEMVGAYPYKSVKVVEGAISAGGAMEYPMVTVIAQSDKAEFINTAIIHEVGHNWFYGILASNERKYPWLDEGINSFYEHKLTNDNQIDQLFTGGKGSEFLAYVLLAGANQLQASDLSSEKYSYLNYGVDIYVKVPMLLRWLEAYMGEDIFEQAMKDYFKTWKFKHLQPQDFEYIFKKHANQDVDWFFNLLSQSDPVDFKLNSFKYNDDSLIVVLNNKTEMKGPVKLNFSAIDENGEKMITSFWTPVFTGKQRFAFENPNSLKWDQVRIDDIVPDYYPADNSSQPISTVGIIAGYNFAEKKKIWISPALGYNEYDGFMAGLLFHNLTLPQNKFQFAIAPLFGFKSNKLLGTGVLGYTLHPRNDIFKEIQFQVSGKTFDFHSSDLNIDDYLSNRYIKIAPEVIFEFKNKDFRSPITRKLRLKAYWVREEKMTYVLNVDEDYYQAEKDGYVDLFYGKISYKHEHARKLNPFNYQASVELGKSFAKMGLEGNLKINYFIEDKGVYLRSYIGKFFNFSESSIQNRRYHLTAAHTGQNDYLYDETYIFRNHNSGFWQNQVNIKEGGMKTHTYGYASPLGLSDNWLWSLNVNADLPMGNLPIQVYGDFVTFSENNLSMDTDRFIYQLGIEFYAGDIISVYFPVISSQNLKNYQQNVLEGKYGNMISFKMNLQEINWLKLQSYLFKM